MNARSRTARTSAGRLGAVVALAALAGCAVERGVALPPMNDWEARRAVLSDIEDWSFTGRVGVKTGDDGFNGRLRWRQSDDEFEASVSGPLGAGTVQIAGDGQRITVVEKNGDVTELADAEFDLRVRYGWTIPVASLRFWALGIPDPATPADTQFGADGRLERLEQRNWVVDIAQYREGGGQLMPRRITAVNDDARVRLVIDSWTFY